MSKVAKRPSLVKDKSVIMTEDKKAMSLLLKFFVFLESFTSKGLNHFCNIYLVVVLGWSPFKASWVWFARDMVRLLFQTLLGYLIDKTENKKALLVLIGVQKILAGIILVTTTSFAAHVFKGATDGFTMVAVLPTITAMTLGTVGKTRFHKKHAGLNSMIQYAGSFFSSILFGGIAYAVYPNLRRVFYPNIVIGVACLFCVLFMPREGDAVNHATARGRSIRNLLNNSKIADRLLETDSDDEDGTDTNPSTAVDVHEDDKAPSKSEYTEVMTFREMYFDPSRGRSLIFLSALYFSFHLVNATILPLLGQFMGFEASTRSSLPIFMALLLIQKFGSFVTTWILTGRLETFGYRNALLLACACLALRLIIIIVVMKFTDNLWLLGATNIFNGFGTGIMHFMLALYSHLLSRQTGHYNLNMAIVGMWESVGSAASILVGGAIATNYSYQTTFIILVGMVIIPTLCVFGIDNVSLTGPVIGNHQPKSDVKA